MRRIELWPSILPFFLVASLGAGQIGQAEAAEGRVFIIAPADGYGVEDCLADGGECGRVVADAWCEAHGRGAALAFGVAEDVTGAIATKAAAAKPAGPYFVRCSD